MHGRKQKKIPVHEFHYRNRVNDVQCSVKHSIGDAQKILILISLSKTQANLTSKLFSTGTSFIRCIRISFLKIEGGCF